jgi:apolipoprotein N-acyltransferase
MCFVSCLSAELDLIGPDAFLGLARNLDTNTRFSSFVCGFILFGFGMVWLGEVFLEWDGVRFEIEIGWEE